uniref:Serrate RNA effector molecule homolog n=1 Tax=Diabrotica virgifera virgifera TaxID=50390 RepID=A0A6P7GZY7_DIAVI
MEHSTKVKKTARTSIDSHNQEKKLDQIIRMMQDLTEETTNLAAEVKDIKEDQREFRLKYHPEESVKRKEEQKAALKRRVDVFIELLNAGKIECVKVDCAETNKLLKLLDTVVIKLEGGTDEDLAALEQEYEEMEQKYREQKAKEAEAEREKGKDQEIKKELEGENPKPVDEEKPNGKADDNEKEKEKDEEIEKDEKIEKDEEIEKVEDKIEAESEPQPEIETIPSEDIENENTEEKECEAGEVQDKPTEGEAPTIVVEETEKTEENLEPAAMDTTDAPEKDGEKAVPFKTKEKKRKRSYSGSSSGSSSSSSDSENEGIDKDAKEEDVEADNNKRDKDIPVHTIDEDDRLKIEKPKSLHKTTSIFLRNLAPIITKQEVEAMCSRYDGFLRVALADPQPDRRWLRRGWVTFKRDANIKEICWNLNNIRLKECELGAIVNRDLSRRIRPVNGIIAHKQVVRSDIRISAKVVLHLDTKAGLWLENEDKKAKPQQTFGLLSNNPVLHNITDYLIEEASAEEEELLGLDPTTDAQDATSVVERDENLITVLDRIILYLRIVHSVDYYNHCDYPNEDEMPNRCGILHARGPPPTSKTDMTQFIGLPIENKMAAFLPEKLHQEKDKNESKLVHLALKNVDTEIDKFVQVNTRELAKDKWLCPLSGKKFKGP